MKIKNKLMMSMVLLASLGSAQTVKKTFYDLNGTKPKEVYSVNSKGEKNGSYKSYYENGIVAVEANYVSGMLNGSYKEFTGYGGKSCQVKSITYKNDVMEGPAIFYSSQECNVKASEGNFQSNRRGGAWTFYERIGQEMPPGFQYIKYTQKLDGETLVEDAKIVYYYPSMKIFSEVKGNVKYGYSPEGKVSSEETMNGNGKVIEEKYYYLNGKLGEHNKRTIENGHEVYLKNSWYEDGKDKSSCKYYTKDDKEYKEELYYYANGKLKQKSVSIDGVYVSYEGYKANGEKDDQMINLEKQQQDLKASYERQRQSCIDQYRQGDSLINIGFYEQATTRFEYLKNYTQDAMKNNKFFNKDTVNSAFLNRYYKLSEVKLAEIKNIDKLQQERKNIGASIVEKQKKFVSIYETNYGNTDVKMYPKGEHLFKYADERIKFLRSAYNQEKDLKQAIAKGNDLLKILDRLISMSDEEAKELNKKLKKAKTEDDKFTIMGF